MLMLLMPVKHKPYEVEECTSHGDDIFLVLAAIAAVAGLLGACPECKMQLWSRMCWSPR